MANLSPALPLPRAGPLQPAAAKRCRAALVCLARWQGSDYQLPSCPHIIMCAPFHSKESYSTHRLCLLPPGPPAFPPLGGRRQQQPSVLALSLRRACRTQQPFDHKLPVCADLAVAIEKRSQSELAGCTSAAHLNLAHRRASSELTVRRLRAMARDM